MGGRSPLRRSARRAGLPRSHGHRRPSRLTRRTPSTCVPRVVPGRLPRIARLFGKRRAAELTDDFTSRQRVLSRPRNLDFLLHRRTQFVRDALEPGQLVLEIGGGLGTTALYVPDVELVCTDARPKPWVAVAADAQTLPFPTGRFDAAIALHVLHHLPSPRSALREMVRVVRPGGLLVIAEPHDSRATRMALAASRHEYIDYAVDPFTSDACQTRPEFEGGGNNAVGDLLFGDLDRFHAEFPGLDLEHHRLVEFLTFLNSGGVSARGPSVPWPRRALGLVGRTDDALARFPRTFPMNRELVFRRT